MSTISVEWDYLVKSVETLTRRLDHLESDKEKSKNPWVRREVAALRVAIECMELRINQNKILLQRLDDKKSEMI